MASSSATTTRTILRVFVRPPAPKTSSLAAVGTGTKNLCASTGKKYYQTNSRMVTLSRPSKTNRDAINNTTTTTTKRFSSGQNGTNNPEKKNVKAPKPSTTSTETSSESTTTTTTTRPSSLSPPLRRADPHAMASEMIQRESGSTRTSGVDALSSMTFEQKARNYLTAAALFGFAAWVWWYSIQSVGKPEGGIEELRAEAEDARRAHERSSKQEEEVEKLMQLETTMSALEATEEEDVDVANRAEKDVIAVAAPDEVATEEEEKNREAVKSKSGSTRPLWKKIVFFWRRE